MTTFHEILHDSEYLLHYGELCNFWVPGIPKPQGSKKAWVNPKTRRAHVTESAGMPLKEWRYDVKMAAAEQMIGHTMVPRPLALAVHISYVLPRPLSLPKTKPTPPATKKPDVDKLDRAVLDALSNTVYVDDSQVTTLIGHKRLAELGEQTGARIVVYAEVTG